jgi:hypothetical protein
VVLLIAFASGACGNSTGPTSAGWLRAELALQAEDSLLHYQGDATFSEGTDVLRGKDWFTAHSRTPHHTESVLVIRQGGKRPAVGSYQVGSLSQGGEGADGIAVMYEWTDSVSARQFWSESGVVNVTASSSSVVYGTFDITAFESCRMSLDPPLPCATPWGSTDQAPRIRLVGTFMATKNESEVIELGPGTLITE